MKISGVARVDEKTKNLTKRIRPREIAVIAHQGIDEVAALSLIHRRVRAIVNASESMSSRYPNKGPRLLIEAGIPIFDSAGDQLLKLVSDGDQLEIDTDTGLILRRGERVGTGRPLDMSFIEAKMREAEAHLADELRTFVANTLDWASKETQLVTEKLSLPRIGCQISGRHCLVVVRGASYEDDLAAISTYIREERPVLIGVDGGADALRELGYKPDIVVGDMDSVSDDVLLSGCELVVHAYPDGRAPGMERLDAMGVRAHTVSAPGTSEDIALLLAYEKGAELIVAVGTHSNMIDFLEKGREGMASTLLVRMKVGSKLVDARGVSELYRARLTPMQLLPIAFAASVPMILVVALSTRIRHIVDLLLVRLQLLLRLR